MYDIDWQAKAYKQLHKIRSRKVREGIYDAVDSLRNWPVCQNVKALTSHEYG